MVAQRIRSAAEKVVRPENLRISARGLVGEDFGYLSRQKLCNQFKLGTKAADQETAPPLHNDRFNVDPGYFQVGIDIMVQFVMDNMDGIDFP